MDWMHDLFGRAEETITWTQMLARGVVVFFAGLALLRLAGKRLLGKWDALDIVLAVLIGSNLSRAMTGNAPLWPTLLTTALLLFLHWLLAEAAARMPALGMMLKGRATRLITDGEIDEGALRRHGVGRHDLEQALRCAGHETSDGVAGAWLERNGEISVISARS